jgi:DNA-binding CsgD family transcriptional regulator
LAKEKRCLDWLGFKSLLAWHYIILFAPLLVNLDDANLASFVFERQLVLYCALAASFGIFMVAGRRLMDSLGTRSPIIPLVFVGLFCMLSTVLTVITAVQPNTPLAWQLLSVALLGMSEALLMCLYLHFNVYRFAEHGRRAMALDMIYGALFAFLCCCLQAPFSFIVIVLMPGIATVSLLVNWPSGGRVQQEATQEARRAAPRAAPQAAQQEAACVPLHEERTARMGFFKTLLPSFVYAAAFGLMQGSLIQEQVMLIMASNPLGLLGIIVSGLLLFFKKDTARRQVDVESLHRISLLLLVLGVLGLSFLGLVGQFVISEAAILAGFNLFDFGTLALTISMTRRIGARSFAPLDGGRCLVYASFAVGLASGFFGSRLVAPLAADAMIYVIGGVAIAMLVITLLIKAGSSNEHENTGSLSKRAITADGFSEESVSPSTHPHPKVSESLERRSVEHVAAAYQLSPREVEVFLFLAKGRNAEYIQNNLVISLHTAKTHIANIYRKLNVHAQQELMDLVDSYSANEDGD